MTESTKLLIAAVEAAGEKIINKTTLVLSYDEGDAFGRVYHDGEMWGEGRVKLDEIYEPELAEDGVKIWRTWNWGECCK